MIYGTRIDEFDLGHWGKMKFSQWLHPNEQPKTFTGRDIDWLAQFIKPGDAAIDIGAFTGDTALPMAVAAGKNGNVYAFEPNPASLNVLLKNQSLNQHLATIFVVPYAIGLRREEKVFRYHCNQINGGFLTEGEPVTVHSIRLDGGVITHAAPSANAFRNQVSYVKFDTEGEDGSLLTEFWPWLKDHGNPVVQVERYPNLTELQKAVLWNAIVSYGTPSLEGDWNFTELKQLPDNLCNIIIRPYA